MVADELCTLACTVLRMLDGALPLHNCPAPVIVGGQLTENGFEIHLPISGGAEPACPVDPALVPAINTLLSCWVKLGILHMKYFDALVVMIDVRQVIEALQYKMRGIVQEAG